MIKKIVLLFGVVLLALGLTGFPAGATNGVTVSVDAPAEVDEGSDFVVRVNITEVTNLFSAQYVVSFNTTVLNLTGVTDGVVGGVTFPIFEYNPAIYSVVQLLVGGVTGSGYLAELHFHVIGSAGDTSDINLTAGKLADTEAAYITATWTGAFVEVVPVVIPGDANGDGEVNVLDLAFTAMIIVELEPNGGLHPGADANQDGLVDVLDLAKIARIIAGLD